MEDKEIIDAIDDNEPKVKTVDAEAQVTLTIGELQTLIQAERINALTPGILAKINHQLA